MYNRTDAEKLAKKIILILIAVALTAVFLFSGDPSRAGKLGGALTPVLIAICIGFIMNIPLSFFENKLFRKWKSGTFKRIVCMLLAVVVILMVLTAVVLVIYPRIAESINDITTNFDTYQEKAKDYYNDILGDIHISEKVTGYINDFVDKIISGADEWIKTLTTGLLSATVNIVSFTVNLLLGLVMAVYALSEKEKLIKQSAKLSAAIWGRQKAEKILGVLSKSNQMVYRYVRGVLIDCSILGTLCFIGMSIFGFPYALLISLTIALTQVVPYIGPWIGGIVGGFIILFSEPSMLLVYIIIIAVVQAIDNYFVYPNVVGTMVGISGLWILIAFLLGGALFGFIGILLCVPLMAVVYSLISEWADKRNSADPLPKDEKAGSNRE